MIYEPAEDSYLLAEQVKKFAFGSVLDVGTGSGIQAIAAAKSSRVKSVLAVDINPEAITSLGKKKVKKIKTQQSDLFSNVKGRFDTILFNAPYLPLDPREPKDSQLATTGGKHGYEILVRFLQNIDDHLTKKGIALILFSSLTHKEKIEEALFDIGYDFEVVGEQKISFETLYVYKIQRNWLLKELFAKNVTNIHKLAKGHRGTIFTGDYKNKRIAIKAQRLELQVRTVDREAGMIKILNKKGIAPKLLWKGKEYFAYEYIPGEFIKDFLEHSKKEETKKVFLEVLRQCRVLDVLKLSKEEMHNPWKHVIVGKKIVLLDFERAHKEPKPNNVTQFCQYLMRNHSLLAKKGIQFRKEELIVLSQKYKRRELEGDFKKIVALVKSR